MIRSRRQWNARLAEIDEPHVVAGKISALPRRASSARCTSGLSYFDGLIIGFGIWGLNSLSAPSAGSLKQNGEDRIEPCICMRRIVRGLFI